MKTTTLCIVISAAISVLFLAILLQGSKKKGKEGFSVQVQEVGMGIGIGVAVTLVVFAAFFFFFYNIPKQPNVVPRRGYFLNNQY